jgi:hypothetical protein
MYMYRAQSTTEMTQAIIVSSQVGLNPHGGMQICNIERLE